LSGESPVILQWIIGGTTHLGFEKLEAVLKSLLEFCETPGVAGSREFMGDVAVAGGGEIRIRMVDSWGREFGLDSREEAEVDEWAGVGLRGESEGAGAGLGWRMGGEEFANAGTADGGGADGMDGCRGGIGVIGGEMCEALVNESLSFVPEGSEGVDEDVAFLTGKGELFPAGFDDPIQHGTAGEEELDLDRGAFGREEAGAVSPGARGIVRRGGCRRLNVPDRVWFGRACVLLDDGGRVHHNRGEGLVGLDGRESMGVDEGGSLVGFSVDSQGKLDQG